MRRTPRRQRTALSDPPSNLIVAVVVDICEKAEAPAGADSSKGLGCLGRTP